MLEKTSPTFAVEIYHFGENCSMVKIQMKMEKTFIQNGKKVNSFQTRACLLYQCKLKSLQIRFLGVINKTTKFFLQTLVKKLWCSSSHTIETYCNIILKVNM